MGNDEHTPHADGADEVWAMLARFDVPLPDAGFVHRLRDALVSHQVLVA